MDNAFRVHSFRGGISDFADKGTPGSFKMGKNLNIRKKEDTLTCNQDLLDEGLFDSSSPSASVSPSVSVSSSPSPSPSLSSSATPSPSASQSPSVSVSLSASATPSISTSPSPSPSGGATSVFKDLIIKFVNASDGYTYGFGDLGNIYKRDLDGFWLRVYTDAAGEIKGAEEKPSSTGKRYLYWATDKILRRKQLESVKQWNSIAGVGDVTTVDSNLNSADQHTMVQIGGALHIANGDVVAYVGYDDSFSSEVLDLIPGNLIKTIVERNARGIYGTFRKGFPTKGINAAIESEVPLIQVGDEGEIYYADMVNSVPVKVLPGGGKVNPGGVWNQVSQVNLFEWEEGASSYIDKQSLGNLALFGVFGADSGYNGVYSLGRKNKNAPFVLNLEYALEVDEIGAGINVEGIDLISYKDGSDYGVKATDLNNKAEATFDALEFSSPLKKPVNKTLYEQVKVDMKALPSGCWLQCYYKMDKNTDYSVAYTEARTQNFNTANAKEALFNIQAQGKIYELRLILHPSGNNSPEIFNIDTYF